MVFKRGVALLALAATAAAAAPITVQTDLKHPVLKAVTHNHGKVSIVLAEGAAVQAKKPVAPRYAEVKKEEKKKHHHHKAKKTEVKKPVVKKEHEKKHAKKAGHKQVSEEKKENGEIIRKYAHGEVRINAKNQPAQESHKKAAKKHAKKDVKKAKKHAKQVPPLPAGLDIGSTDGSEDDSVEEANVDLAAGEAVTVQFGDHEVQLELLGNGSLVLIADGERTVLPHVDGVNGVDIEIEDSDDSTEAGSAAGSAAAPATAGSTAPAGSITGEPSLLTEVEEDVSNAAKKFKEFATKLTGSSNFSGAAPVIFVGSIVGALAAVVGIAVIAVGRARGNSNAADPQSVLAEATEDVDVEANVTKKDSEDAEAEDSQSLSESDSDSEAEDAQEEGKFTNEVASV